MAKKKSSYKVITAKIIFITLFFTVVFAFSYGEYMKKNAISELAQVDARKTSMLIFETLYSAMQRGWTKSDIEEIINRLNRVDPNMGVNIYRSEIVSHLFGEIAQDKMKRETDSYVKEAMAGKPILSINDKNFIEYYYPVNAKEECLKCHVNANVGDALGVISVSYPIENLKISLSAMINVFIVFIIIFSLIIFVAIFIELDAYLIKPIKNFSNSIKSITNSTDITQRVEINDNIEEIDSIKDVFNGMLDAIEHQFYHDVLTGLYNRRKLTEILDEGSYSFLMIINLDAFQEINDLYGEEIGDFVLKEFGEFLQTRNYLNGKLFRLHSDEFAYISQSDIADIKEFTLLAQLLSDEIAQKRFYGNGAGEINLTATIGIACGTQLLLANADIALSLAKKNRKNYLVYNDSMTMAKEYEKNIEWTKRLKKAIDENRIIPLFQPIVDTKTEKIVKYEALIRILDHNGNYISPIHFLELSKKSKLYHQLTKIMIEKSFERFKDLPYPVSINLSVEDILNREVYTYILKKLEETGMGEQVIFEIIESEGIENFAEVLDFIYAVKKFGAKISIDDFGTGYSNFDYLMKLRVDYIKIDGSMIKSIDHDKNAQMITQTIVEFARRMNIQTVAEFVYSKNVFDKVAELEVDFAQGYYFGEPSEKIL